MFNKFYKKTQPRRQYQAFNIEELNVTATLAWNSINSLALVLQELMHRKTKRAFHLQNKIEKRIEQLSKANQYASTADDMLFAEIGLHPSAPDFVVDAAQKAYRNNHSRTSKAKEAFNQVEKVFRRIYERS